MVHPHKSKKQETSLHIKGKNPPAFNYNSFRSPRRRITRSACGPGSFVGKLDSLKLVLDAYRKFHPEEFIFVGSLKNLPDRDDVIVRALLAGAEKTPPHSNGIFGIAFQNETEDVSPVEKKLYDEGKIGDLVSFSLGDFGQVDRVIDRNASGGIII